MLKRPTSQTKARMNTAEQKTFLVVGQVMDRFIYQEELVRRSGNEGRVALGSGVVGQGSYLVNFQEEPRTAYYAGLEVFHSALREVYGSRLLGNTLNEKMNAIEDGEVIQPETTVWSLRGIERGGLSLQVVPVDSKHPLLYAHWVFGSFPGRGGVLNG